MKTISLGLASILTFSTALASPIEVRSSSPQVTIKNGTIRGVTNSALGAEAFLGLPYARAPRFGNPIPVDDAFDGVFDASSYGNICPGYGVSSTSNATAGQNYVIDEDCLNINVIRPAGTTEDDKLPVLFWIYGGGFVQGTANDPRYNGTYLVQRSVDIGKPIIFASINYRVAAFGFPAGQAAADAGVLNLGLKDQRAALRWVQENIGAFGGDKSKVTIWGQSAGGASVVSQMLAYGGDTSGYSLFRAAISDSGVFATQNASIASQAPSWQRFLDAAGCGDDLKCLRALPFDTVFAAANGTFNPAVIPDGDFVQGPTFKQIGQNKVLRIPLVLGANHDEGTSGIGAPMGIQNDTQFRSAVARAYSTLSLSNKTIDEFLTVFPDDPSRGCPFGTGNGVLPTGLQDKRINWVYTDGLHAGVRYLAQKHSKRAPVYKYHFTQVPQNGTIDAGVAHFYEIPYIFGVMDQTVRNPMSQRPGDLETSRYMQEYWINFVHDLKPSASGAPEWKKYYEGQQVLDIQNYNTKMLDDTYRKASISFLTDLASAK
ncbi:alpha/beta-hydrolase [Cystobasidium minutum MCA 4210]|uniref:alpha/beta-hydrolase n=1 Tax=Cystobasidium minutum MCA 4210 TaxID=1397322 RepID=UPI0034CF80D0|eukprot:jgi/Rhomi1/165139/fgenesh1_kg.1_\